MRHQTSLPDPWPPAPLARPNSDHSSGSLNQYHRILANRARPFIFSLAALLSLLIATVSPTLLCAQSGRGPESSRDIGFSLSAAPIYQFPTHVDGGGHLRVIRYHVKADVTKRINQEVLLGLGLIYEFDDYQFSGVKAFPVGNPWRQVQRLGVSLPIISSLTDKWLLVIVPSAQFSGELGARLGEAMTYGGVVSASYAFRLSFRLGFGVGTYANLEKVSVFPYLAVNWQITKRLRLTNPFRTSPAGPAGLELSYNLHPDWEIGVGGAYRSYRFRLGENGSIPNGIGEARSFPVFARLSYKFSPACGVDLYGGAAFANKLWLDDPDGDERYRSKYAAAPLVGLTLKGSF